MTIDELKEAWVKWSAWRRSPTQGRARSEAEFDDLFRIEYHVYDADGACWAIADSLSDAGHYCSQDPEGHIERVYISKGERVND